MGRDATCDVDMQMQMQMTIDTMQRTMHMQRTVQMQMLLLSRRERDGSRGCDLLHHVAGEQRRVVETRGGPQPEGLVLRGEEAGRHGAPIGDEDGGQLCGEGVRQDP